MKVIKWTEWSDEHFDDIESKEELDAMADAVVEELRKTNYHFDGSYHQNGDYGVPVLDNGKYFQVTQRVWGEVMVMAYPEEFDNPEAPYNYIVWYLGPGNHSEYIYPEGDNYE